MLNVSKHSDLKNTGFQTTSDLLFYPLIPAWHPGQLQGGDGPFNPPSIVNRVLSDLINDGY